MQTAPPQTGETAPQSPAAAAAAAAATAPPPADHDAARAALRDLVALCAQCAATLAVIKRETNSWRWPIFTFVYMTTLAYFAALVTYQVGMSFA